MKSALSYGPITAGVDFKDVAFKNYSGGIITSCANTTSLGAFVLIVGWGKDSSDGEFWSVKSSIYNTSSGYVKIAI